MSDNELAWRTSSYSGTQGGNCVEVARHAGMILLRDTKDHGPGAVHRFTAAGWHAFLVGVRSWDFDRAESGRLP
jgi:hypothetical protein